MNSPINTQPRDSSLKSEFFPHQVMRLVATMWLFLVPCAVGTDRMGLVCVAILLTELDLIDCPWAFTSRAIKCTSSSWYQCVDKLIDQMQYMVALALIWNWPLITAQRRLILIIALSWRWVGVLSFVLSKGTEPKFLVLFPDLFKELLVLWGCFPKSGGLAIALVIVGKVIFEGIKCEWSTNRSYPRALQSMSQTS